MIRLTRLRELDLDAPLTTGRGAYISAASGLVRVGGWLYVVADDEHHLGVFEVESAAPGSVMELLPGELPVAKKDRKRAKPDFESLLRLPPFEGCPDGALLALGSGSRPNRRRGALLALDPLGRLSGVPRVVTLDALYQRMQRDFPELNIEGAVVVERELWLLQRGGKSGSANACLRFPLDAFLALLGDGTEMAIDPRSTQLLDLGAIDGLPLCFSDATLMPDGALLFSAITEDTENSYEDGRCGGAAIGILAADASIRILGRVDPGLKIEGIEARFHADRIELLLVTDDDDPDKPSALYAGTIEL